MKNEDKKWYIDILEFISKNYHKLVDKFANARSISPVEAIIHINFFFFA